MELIGVMFRKKGKVHFCVNTVCHLQIRKGDSVIVETPQGEEFGDVLVVNKCNDNNIPTDKYYKIKKLANEMDKKHYADNLNKEKEAMEIIKDKIKQFNLDMKVVSTEYLFDNSKLLFYFNAEGRIDFRDLVKELASVFKTRIELRQIGVRDEIRKIGGNGVCGRELCCCSFLSNFESISMKTAKEQNIALNPSKISGNCGRLMCCIKYEQKAYEDKLKNLPKQGSIVKTEDGEGVVDNIEILKEVVRVKFKDGEGFFYKKYNAKDVKVLKNIEKEELSPEEKENLKELKRLEKLDKIEKQE